MKEKGEKERQYELEYIRRNNTNWEGKRRWNEITVDDRDSLVIIEVSQTCQKSVCKREVSNP